jgi:hypothetical protein
MKNIFYTFEEFKNDYISKVRHLSGEQNIDYKYILNAKYLIVNISAFKKWMARIKTPKG